MRRTLADAEGISTPIRGRIHLSAATRALEDTRDSLELAIVSGAPTELVDRLALVAGLLGAIVDLASDGPPIVALTASTLEKAGAALDAWRTWQRGLLPRTG
jgi:hypothetical protein